MTCCLAILVLLDGVELAAEELADGDGGGDAHVEGFAAGGLDVSVETRATPVTELATFNVLASTGSAGSESQAWAPVAVTKSGSTYLTGKYWPAADPSYHFYASNAALTFAAAGSTVTADGSTDVVCAYLPSPAYGEPNALTFDHIYARVGSFSVATQSGYEISAVSATLKNGVSGGTYNLRTGAWSGLSAASDRACASFTGGTSSQSSSNDIWLVPGTYTISVSYTLTKGEYVVPFTKTGSVTLVAGKTNNISTTAVGGSASEIVFSVSLASWSLNSVDLVFTSDQVNPHPFSVAAGRTVKFTTANLMYEGSATNKWHLMEHPWSMVESNVLSSSGTIALFGWATSGYNSKNPWMTSTTNEDYGPALDSGEWDPAASWDWGKYNSIYDYSGMLLSDTRVLTKNEWSYLLTNANASKGKINGICGLLFFSDDYSHPSGLPAMVYGIDDEDCTYHNSFTSVQFEQMSAAGAIFLPNAGQGNANSGEISKLNDQATYWTSTIRNSGSSYFLIFDGWWAELQGATGRSPRYSVRLVVDE